MTRRKALHAVGCGLAVAPLLKLLERAALAEPSAVLERFIGIYMPHGVAKELWRPGPDFDIAYPECSLKPFDDAATYGVSLKQNLLVIEGLDLTAGIEGGTTGHEASRAILTGSPHSGTNPSLDQFLAIEQGLGRSTPESSLVLGVGVAQVSPGFAISYGRGGNPLAKIIDPALTFRQAFARFVVSDDPVTQAREEQRRRRNQSVLDYLVSDANRLSSRLAGAERAKLEQHLTSLRDLEKRLASFELACSAVPAAPDMGAIRSVSSAAGGEPYFDKLIDLQVDLLAQALECNITRFATLFLPDLSHTQYDTAYPGDVHDKIAHRYVARLERTDGSVEAEGKPETWQALAYQNRYLYGKVARLAAHLVNSNTLDGTLIYATSDMGDPARHSSRHVPTVLVSGAGSFPMARYLKLTKAFGATPVGVPHNRLLVSICRAFGVFIDQFGDSPVAETNQGDLGELA